MPTEPTCKRVIAFFDGQNLFYAAKQAFGYPWPNYDPIKLAQAICQTRGLAIAADLFLHRRTQPR